MEVRGGHERQSGGVGGERDGGVKPAAGEDRVEVAGRIGVEQSRGSPSLQSLLEEIAFPQDACDQAIGLGAVVGADSRRDVFSCKESRLPRSRLGSSGHAQCGIQRKQCGVRTFEGSRAGGQRLPIQQMCQARHPGANEGVPLRIGLSQPHPVEEENQDAGHLFSTLQWYQAEVRPRSSPCLT